VNRAQKGEEGGGKKRRIGRGGERDLDQFVEEGAIARP